MSAGLSLNCPIDEWVSNHHMPVGARHTARRGSRLKSVGRQRNEAHVVDGTADREVI